MPEHRVDAGANGVDGVEGPKDDVEQAVHEHGVRSHDTAARTRPGDALPSTMDRGMPDVAPAGRAGSARAERESS
jgi:hypothetical protein